MHLALSCVTVSLKALSAVPSQLSSFATVLSTETWHVSQVTEAPSVHFDPALVQALSPPTAQVPFFLMIPLPPSSAVLPHTTPFRSPTFASVGTNWHVVTPAATV